MKEVKGKLNKNFIKSYKSHLSRFLKSKLKTAFEEMQKQGNKLFKQCILEYYQKLNM